MTLHPGKFTRVLVACVLFTGISVVLGGRASAAMSCDPEFEGGADGTCWTLSSDTGRALITTESPKSGSYAASLCGDHSNCVDQLSQVVEVPEDADYSVLTFSVKGTSLDPDENCGDQLKIGLVDPIFTDFVDGFSYCEEDTRSQLSDWQTVTVYPSIDMFRGSTATLVIDARTDEAAATHWFVDNLTYTVTEAPPPPVTLTVDKAGAAQGHVASAPAGIDCGETCSADFATGSLVDLTADAADGSEFAGWSGGGCSGTGVCTVTMDSAKTVTATFQSTGGGGGDDGDTVTNHSRSVSLSLARHLRAVGSVSAGGYGPCQKASTVRIQRRVSGVFKTIKTVGTGTDNKYATDLPDRKGVYRAQVVAKIPSSTHKCLADYSPTRRHTH